MFTLLEVTLTTHTRSPTRRRWAAVARSGRFRMCEPRATQTASQLPTNQ